MQSSKILPALMRPLRAFPRHSFPTHAIHTVGQAHAHVVGGKRVSLVRAAAAAVFVAGTSMVAYDQLQVPICPYICWKEACISVPCIDFLLVYYHASFSVGITGKAIIRRP
jgi:hypothetical protein